MTSSVMLGGVTTALQCNASNQDALVLDSVPYGTSGRWAVSLWVQFGDLFGEGGNILTLAHFSPPTMACAEDSILMTPKVSTFPDSCSCLAASNSYVYSHWNVSNAAAVGAGNVSLAPNQVNIYAPQTGNPSYGVVRTLVLDSTDTSESNSSLTFIDDDGQVGNALVRNLSENTVNVVEDGRWHMATVTTHSEGGKGFKFYIDGKLVGQTLSNETYTGSDGTRLLVEGGGPMYLDSPITLCGRVDLDPARFFSGRLAELSIFDTALTPQQVAYLFSQGINGLKNISAPAGVGEYYVNGLQVCNLQPVAGAPAATCAAVGGRCTALSNADVQLFGLQQAATQGKLGLCVPNLPVPLPTQNNLPQAYAFFPLNDPDFLSWPLPYYFGVPSNAATAPDQLFGKALSCNREAQSALLLSPLQYAQNGTFSINFWQRVARSYSNNAMYLLSHQSQLPPEYISLDSTAAWDADQIQIYFPAIATPQLGLVRAVVKDNDDTDIGAASVTFLDSDGVYSNANAVLPANTSANPTAANVSRQVPINAMDQNWHMVTLTSLAQGVPGYRLYIDGQLMGEVSGPGADGGGPFDLNGSIVLCGRSDGDAERFFDGSIAYLGLYDFPLDADMVSELYSAVPVNTTTPANETCQFPLMYSGRSVRSCFEYQGRTGCWAEAGQWIACGSEKGAVGPAANVTGDPVPVGPFVNRTTLDGQLCRIPVVFEGELYDDCTMVNGTTEACIVYGGGWAQCAPKGSGGGGGGGLSGGAIAGIVIGSIVGVLLLAVLLAWLIKRRHVKATSSFHKYMDEVPVTATAAGTGNAQLNGHSTI